MTVRVTTISGGAGTGAAVGRYYSQVMERQKDVVTEVAGPDLGGRVAAYYESASGAFWMGASAERLGLEGVPTGSQIGRLIDGVDADGVQLGRKFGDSSARAFDVTFSVQKEISILWAAAGPEVREIIEQAIVDAATAVLDDQVGARAATRMRTGPDGDFLAADKKPVMVDAEGPAVAVIPEFTSRKGDPQLHIHGLVSSKVWEPTTERWLALEARELKQDQRALSGMFHAGLEAELSSKLGVTWGSRVYAYARTIDGISDGLIDRFSQRRADVDARLTEKLERFEASLGHAPTPQQRWRLEREAAVDSRPSKSAEVLDFDGWHQTITGHTGMAPELLVESVTGRDGHIHSLSQAQVDEMVTAAVGELSDVRSSWTRGDFKAELTRVLPPNLAVTPTQLVQFINTQTDAALGRLVQVTPATVDRPVRRWTAPDVLTQETRIVEHIEQSTAPVIEANTTVEQHAPDWIDPLQLQAAARVASDSRFELVIGPAGTGKTTMLSTAIDTLKDDGRHVFGLAPSAAAAQVLADETLMDTDNVAKFLWEHFQRTEGPSPDFVLPTGTTLIVDEAGMVSTPQWAALTELAAAHDWRVVAVGDGYQFSAVGRGGMFDHLTNTLPDHRISRLEQIHRFTNDWEADASTALRNGDPTVIDTYIAHGRIHAIDPATIGAGDLVDQVVDRWMEEHTAGRQVAMFAGSNETVFNLNAETQQRLQQRGELGAQIDTGNPDDIRLYVGDQIETRRNNRDLVTDQNLFVKNRDRWTITNQTADGIVLTGKTGTVTVPVDYLAEHSQLGYAQTSHASQGRTIRGSALTVYDPQLHLIDRAGVYVPMTRGTESNELFVSAENLDIARQLVEDAVSRRWIDTPAITHLTEQVPVPLVEQIEASHERLDTYTQDTLFNLETPSPPINPTPPQVDADRPAHRPSRKSAKIRSEAQERQHPQPAATPPPAAELPEVLSTVEFFEHVKTVDRLRWPIENASRLISELDTKYDRTFDHYQDTLTERNQLLEERNTHAEKPPLVRGIKKWETALTVFDQKLDRYDQTITDLVGDLDKIKEDRAHWGGFQGLAVRMEYGGAVTALEQDRELRGQHAAQDPAMVKRLGLPPVEPEALATWHQAAGAIEHHHTFKHHRFSPDIDLEYRDHHIGSELRTEVKDALGKLAEHVGIEHIPELNQQTERALDRGLDRDLGLGL